MKFGMFGKDGIFGYVGSLPEKQEVQVNKEATWVSFAETSENLMAMYSANNNIYMELSNVSSGPSKAGKLKRSGSEVSVVSAKALPNKFKSSVVRANSGMDFGSI